MTGPGQVVEIGAREPHRVASPWRPERPGPSRGTGNGTGSEDRRRRRRRPIRVAVRRRRVVALLSAVVLLAFGLGFVPGLAPAWVAAAVLAGMEATYAGLRLHIRDRDARREMAKAFGEAWVEAAWASLLSEASATATAGTTSDSATGRAPAHLLDRWAVTRYLWAGAAGYLLKLVIAVTDRLADGAPAGPTPAGGTDRAGRARRAWAERGLRLQAYLRSQTLRTLTASAAATAGATAIGAIANVAAAAPPAAAIPGGALAAQALAATAPAAAAPAGGTYTVRWGDTLFAIARRFGTSVSAIARANGISNPNLIFAGQVLQVGRAPSAAPVERASGGSTYTVHPGDTLFAIARRFGTSVSAIARANGISNPNLIFAGHRLTIPGGAAPTSATLTRATTPEAQAAPDPPPAPPAPAPAPPVQAPGQGAATAVRVALQQVGKPYQWAGAGPSSFDCSGLVMYAWKAAGVSLPHYTVAQYNDTARISASQLRPGDIVFYDTPDAAEPGHEALYIGNGQVVAANNAGVPVQVQSITWDGTPMGFGRVG